jgi:hypothetical protein
MPVTAAPAPIRRAPQDSACHRSGEDRERQHYVNSSFHTQRATQVVANCAGDHLPFRRTDICHKPAAKVTSIPAAHNNSGTNAHYYIG